MKINVTQTTSMEINYDNIIWKAKFAQQKTFHFQYNDSVLCGLSKQHSRGKKTSTQILQQILASLFTWECLFTTLLICLFSIESKKKEQ